MIGVIFTAYPFGTLLIAPVIGRTIEHTGHRFWIIGGLFFIGVNCFILGLLSNVENT